MNSEILTFNGSYAILLKLLFLISLRNEETILTRLERDEMTCKKNERGIIFTDSSKLGN